MNKKTPATTEAMTSATHSAIVADQHQADKPMHLTPRQSRALALLLPGHWVARETFDREVGASNGPDLIQQLRRKLGHGAIDMQHFDMVDRDGRPCRPGRYRLTDAGRERLAFMREVAQ